jgi:acetylornithine deacetylase/succinyl-diaminopimelate desuccinylase-like protein
VPIINLEWIQKLHRDKESRGYSTEAVVDTILRRMPDYVNYICPQFSETHVNFQRVPTVDTSNPFIARYIPTADESFVVIRFANPEGHRFSVSAVDDPRLVHVAPNIIVVPGGKMELAMQLILTPLILKLMDAGAALTRSLVRRCGLRLRETVGGYSLLYTWPGTDAGAKPILLMAHQDVVPIAPGTEASWHADPFGGEIRDGFVWGRGSWDDKGNLLAMLEAVDRLVASGFKPRRTIYLAFGHDEENGGADGAAQIAALLAKRGVHCEFALDEGLLTTIGIMPGLSGPLALIGVAEKGSVTLRLTASATPGHSSMPPKTSAIGELARALERLEAAPMPAKIGTVAGELLDTVAPEMHGLQRVALSNRWLFGPFVRAQLEQAPSTNALLRTTTAITVIKGGNKENVLPGVAEALVNFRILPGDRIATVVEHVRRTIDDAHIRIDIASEPDEASAVSSRESDAYRSSSARFASCFPTCSSPRGS